MSADDTRERILQAGTRLFAQNGLAGTSVRDIAEAAKANVSLVSYYFGGKEGLFKACIEKFGNGKLESARRLFTRAGSPQEFVLRTRMFLEEMLQNYLDEPDLVKMLNREFEQQTEISCDVFKTTFLEVFKQLNAFIEKAQDDGFVRKDFDPRFVAGSVFAYAHHFIRSDVISKRYFKISITQTEVRQHVLDQVTKVLEGFCKGAKS